MEKKKYDKPIVLDLNGNSANGGPLACLSGDGVLHPSCGGGSADAICITGTAGAQVDACRAGFSASGAACLGGIEATTECESGSSGYLRGLCNNGTSI